MSTLLITNAQIVNEGSVSNADLFVRNDRIERIGPQLTACNADIVIEAAGRWLMPGMIDAHVHFREPGMEAKADLHSESRAAVAGGVTSVMDMPNTRPAAITNELVEAKFALASTRCLVNHSFYLGASNDNLSELLAIDRENICGIKLFMGASTGNLLVDREHQLKAIFEHVQVPLALHCEDTGLIQQNEAVARSRYGDAIPFSEHPFIRSTEACYQSTARAVELAQRYNTRIHLLHISTARELQLLRAGPVSEKRITAEVCPHHLWFCANDYAQLGAAIKCNPAIKTAVDRTALRQALKENVLDTVGTDHAPHLAEEKQRPYGAAPSGLPNIQSALVSLFEFLPPEIVAEKTAHNPARIFGIRDRGFLREGYYADLVLVDPATPHTVAKENIQYKCGWSPFEGTTFHSSIVATIVSGRLAYRDGCINDSVRGKRLQFDP